MIRFALYMRFEPLSIAVTLGATAGFLALALWGYDPARGMMTRKG